MAKRFMGTGIWDEDWFLDMPCGYKLFWFYMLSTCDYAGFFKLNLRGFCALNEVKVTPTEALSYFNAGKERIRVISPTMWFIEDFFAFQYGASFNIDNHMHRGLLSLYNQYDVDLKSIRGIKDFNLTPKRPQKEGNDTLKDKDKDKDKDKYSINGKNQILKGSYFDLRKKIVRYEDGSVGELTEDEFNRAKDGTLDPSELTKP
jgi:hypothetical protein